MAKWRKDLGNVTQATWVSLAQLLVIRVTLGKLLSIPGFSIQHSLPCYED